MQETTLQNKMHYYSHTITTENQTVTLSLPVGLAYFMPVSKYSTAPKTKQKSSLPDSLFKDL